MPDIDSQHIDDRLINVAFERLRADARARMAPAAVGEIVTGAHRRRRIQVAAVAAATVLFITVPVVVYALHAPPARKAAPIGPSGLPLASCGAATLPLPADIGTYTEAMNLVMDPSGRFIVGTMVDNRMRRAEIVEWDNGVPHELPIPATGFYIATAVNRSGIVVGRGGDANTNGWVVRDGRLSILVEFAGTQGEPAAINSAGTIVGTARSTDLADQYPVFWPADYPGTVNQIPTAREGATASGIDDNGTILGVVYENNGYGPRLEHPSTWPLEGHVYGPPQLLPALDSLPGIETVSGIHNGWVAGVLYGSGPDRYPTIWRVGASTPTMVSHNPDVTLSEVNSSGVAVGWIADRVHNSFNYAVVYRDGRLSQLPASTPGARNWATAINDSGDLIAGVRSPDSLGNLPGQAMIWRC